jgi:hypothetical protein
MEGASPELARDRKEARLCRRRYSCAWRPWVRKILAANAGDYLLFANKTYAKWKTTENR